MKVLESDSYGLRIDQLRRCKKIGVGFWNVNWMHHFPNMEKVEGDCQIQIEIHVEMMNLNAPNVYMDNYCTSTIQCYALSQTSLLMPIQCYLLLHQHATVRSWSSMHCGIGTFSTPHLQCQPYKVRHGFGADLGLNKTNYTATISNRLIMVISDQGLVCAMPCIIAWWVIKGVQRSTPQLPHLNHSKSGVPWDPLST